MNPSVYSPLSDLAIMALRIKGTPLRVIAAALGISDTTVGTRIRALRRAGLSLEGAARLAQADAPALDEVCARISSVPTTKRVPQAAPPAAGHLPKPNEAAMRRCLGGCGKLFNSSHAGHRICYRCQPHRAHVTPFTPESL